MDSWPLSILRLFCGRKGWSQEEEGEPKNEQDSNDNDTLVDGDAPPQKCQSSKPTRDNILLAVGALQNSLNNLPVKDRNLKEDVNAEEATQMLTPLWLSTAKKEFNTNLQRLEKPPPSSVKLEDFCLLKTIGTGTFARVMHIRHTQSGSYHAMKIFNKKKIIQMKQVQNTVNEKRLLSCLNFPFIVKLKYHFKDNSNLYLVLDYVQGGELLTLIQKMRRFPEPQAKFYAAQIILTFEYLHHLELVYRDLKPENLLVDFRGYLKLTDFGFIKQVPGRTYTLCGTPDYLAPEMIQNKGYNKSVDWWSLGVLIFEMVAGYPPFRAESPIKTYEKIVEGRPQVPSHFSADLKHLLTNLLQVDVSKRYGNLKSGVRDVKNHPWFYGLDWDSIFKKKEKAPYIPQYKGASDTSNFDQYDEEPLTISKKKEYGSEFSEF